MQKEKLNIFLYERDSIGNQASIFAQDDKLKEYVKNTFGEANIKVYIDQCSLNSECESLKKLVKDLEVEDVDWVATTYSNRFYRLNYKDGRKKLLEILNNINKNGTNIAFSEESIHLKNEQDIFKYVSAGN